MAKNVPLKFQFQDQIMILTLVSHGHAIRGSFTNYVNKILAFFDHLTPSVDIFYDMNVEK